MLYNNVFQYAIYLHYLNVETQQQRTAPIKINLPLTETSESLKLSHLSLAKYYYINSTEIF